MKISAMYFVDDMRYAHLSALFRPIFSQNLATIAAKSVVTTTAYIFWISNNLSLPTQGSIKFIYAISNTSLSFSVLTFPIDAAFIIFCVHYMQTKA